MSEARCLPRSIAERIHADLLEELVDGLLVALVPSMAWLAHRDLAEFERVWDEAAERIIDAAVERAHARVRAWAAPESRRRAMQWIMR